MDTLIEAAINPEALSNYLEVNKQRSQTYVLLQNLLETIRLHIKNNTSATFAESTETSKECDVCAKPIKHIDEDKKLILQCSHQCCSNECLKNHVLHSNPHIIDYEETKCPKCFKYILPNIIEKAFGGKDRLKQSLNDYEEQKAPRFDCGICFSKIKFDEGIKYKCEHKFCKTCVTNFVNHMIDQGSVSEKDISCSICSMPISATLIKSLVSKTYYDKFIKFRNRSFLPTNEKGSYVFYRCNGIDCEWFAICDMTVELVKCPSCRTTNCPKCLKIPHLGITCEEVQRKVQERLRKQREDEKILKDKKIEEEFLQATRNFGYKACPHCKSICEKIDGCGFIKCYSKSCGGRNNFCYLCGKAITDAQHTSHFKNQGPYSKVCNTIDGTPE